MIGANAHLAEDLLALADRAAALRRGCLAAVAPQVLEAGSGRVLARQVTDGTWDADACALYWQTVADFAMGDRGGRRIPLSGGYEAVHRRETIEIRRCETIASPGARLSTGGETCFGPFRFRPVSELHPMHGGVHGEIVRAPGRRSGTAAASGVLDGGDAEAWSTWLPAEATLEVRAWEAGDRMDSSGGRPRRVKRFFADRRVAAPDREGWPVVVADGEIVWIPGVRRGPAATVRPGRPRVCFVCERLRS
jgi:tRNA(Ile)-lysidine synthetase-like protein